jgi:general nucleoside transport system permease protein
MILGPLVQFPMEWAALALLVVACLFWERSGLSGLGVEGCVASAWLGLFIGYEVSGQFAIAVLCAVGASALFALLTGAMVQLTRVDPAVGTFAASLVPWSALTLLLRQSAPALATQSPAPGLIAGTPLDGTYGGELALNPMVWAAPILLVLGAAILANTPFGLRLRAFGENPGWWVPGAPPAAYRLGAVVVGSLFCAPAVALLARANAAAPPAALGILALACAIAARWSLLPAVLLAAGPALLRAARPLAASAPEWGIALDLAPFVLALLYLVLLSRRALRLALSPQTGTDPDVL